MTASMSAHSSDRTISPTVSAGLLNSGRRGLPILAHGLFRDLGLLVERRRLLLLLGLLRFFRRALEFVRDLRLCRALLEVHLDLSHLALLLLGLRGIFGRADDRLEVLDLEDAPELLLQ